MPLALSVAILEHVISSKVIDLLPNNVLHICNMYQFLGFSAYQPVHADAHQPLQSDPARSLALSIGSVRAELLLCTALWPTHSGTAASPTMEAEDGCMRMLRST